MTYLGFPTYSLVGNGVTIAFNTGSLDAEGCAWNLDGPLNGWDSPDARVTMLTKIGAGPNADGELPADQHYRGRTISFSLSVACPSEAAREAARYRLSQAVDLVDSTGVFTANENTPKNCVVSRSGNTNQGKLTYLEQGLSSPAVATPGFAMPATDSNNLIYIMKADVEVYAEDPRKYAVTPITGSFGTLGPDWGLAFNNPGNTATPRLSWGLTGASVGFFQVWGNGGITVVAALHYFVPNTPGPALPGFPGQLDTFPYSGAIEDGSGNDFYYLRDLQVVPWPFVPIGTGNFILSDGLAGVAGTLTYFPAWI